MKAESELGHHPLSKMQDLSVLNLTCMLRKNPAWLKELKLRAAVRNMVAATGVFTWFKQSSDTPGPMKPIDCQFGYEP